MQGPPEVCSSAGRDEQKQTLICTVLWRSSARTLTRTDRDPPGDREAAVNTKLTRPRIFSARYQIQTKQFPPCQHPSLHIRQRGFASFATGYETVAKWFSHDLQKQVTPFVILNICHQAGSVIK